MGFIWYIIIGIVAGFLAGKVMRGGGFGLIINLLLGILGGVLGGWVFALFGLSASGLIGSLITSTVGELRQGGQEEKERLCRLLGGFRLSHRHGGGGGAGVPGTFTAELGTLRLHGDYHPQKDAADLVAAALCDGRPGAGAGEHRHFLE